MLRSFFTILSLALDLSRLHDFDEFLKKGIRNQYRNSVFKLPTAETFAGLDKLSLMPLHPKAF